MAGGLALYTKSVVISAEEGGSSRDERGPRDQSSWCALPRRSADGDALSGKFQIAIDSLAIHADEADVNVRTDEVELRGNVTVLNPPAAPR